MAVIASPMGLLALPAAIQGRVDAGFSGVALLPSPGRLLQDFRFSGPTSGAITDRVMVKLAPSVPETAFANGRVWLLRAEDGYKAWEGWSDAQGWYRARGLEVGVEYIAVGIDPYRDHKATGAGPVLAVEDSP